MSLKMECRSKWKVSQQNIIKKGILPKMGCHSKLNVTQIEGHPKKNVTQNGMSFKKECNLKCNFIQN